MYDLLGGGVQVLDHDRLRSASRQDGNCIGQDGKCVQDGFQVGRAKVQLQSRGGTLWLKTCVYGLLGGVVQVRKHDRAGSASRQDGYSIGQDGKCVQQAIETHDRTISKWAQPRSGYRVRVGW